MKKKRSISVITVVIWVSLIVVMSVIIITSMGNKNALENISADIESTRAYFCSEITYTYGNGDCILLENTDLDGNKVYGLIDAGRKINVNDKEGNQSTVVKEFLREHGVDKLQFLAITHSHGDHNGDALTVLDNFDVDTIYMKEFDSKWSVGGTQSVYEDIIERAVEKDIKVIGVSYLSLKSSQISPSRSSDFVNNTANAKEELFESFYYNSDNDTNIIFKFGSATIKIFNWEIFDVDGNQYITGISTTQKETVDNENNNSITFLVIQGNKKGFFSGDMNNLDENIETGRIGDEDRIKNEVGDIDFLKLGHHGYNYSNTEDYLNVLKPEYAVITNDIACAYQYTINWLEENNVNYIYTTADEKSVSVTLTDNDVYLGFETTGTSKNIAEETYYIPLGEKYKYVDYTKIAYKPIYKEKNVSVSNFSELKRVIEENADDVISFNENDMTATFYDLKINLKSGDYNASDKIEVLPNQKITLVSSDNITILRTDDTKDLPLFDVKGELTIGDNEMGGNIQVDGNKENVQATSALIRVESGTLNLNNNTVICNNLNRITSRTRNSPTQEYIAAGSGIFANRSVININGANIVDNEEDVKYTLTLPKETTNAYKLCSLGAGIYIKNYSTLNMYDGKISGNSMANNSEVKTNKNYSTYSKSSGITQNCQGAGVYAVTNSKINLLGGEISGNTGTNSSITTVTAATQSGKTTKVYSISSGVHGVGLYASNCDVNISNGFLISNNTSKIDSSITIEKGAIVTNSVNSGARGAGCYIISSDVKIDDAIIEASSCENNVDKVISNGAIGVNGTSNPSLVNFGGAIAITNGSKFDISNLKVYGCDSQKGAGIYTDSSNGTIKNSEFSNCVVTDQGGAIYNGSNSNIKIIDSKFMQNEAKYGGAIFANSSAKTTELVNIMVSDNTSIGGSGAGVFAYGNLKISGDNTVISNNLADTYGGGIMVKGNAVISGGTIKNNEAKENSGGGIRVDGTLALIDGNITENIANKTGGGIDFSTGKLYMLGGTIENNTAKTEGNDIYPSTEKLSTDTVNPNFVIEEISDAWTNDGREIYITAMDDETGIKSVTIEGNEVQLEGDKYKYVVKENGTYTVVIEDNASNRVEKSFTVSNIDKNLPIISGISNNEKYSSSIKPEIFDEESGVDKIELKKDNVIIANYNGEEITERGSYVLTVIDKAGNIAVVEFEINFDDVKKDEDYTQNNSEGETLNNEPKEETDKDIVNNDLKENNDKVEEEKLTPQKENSSNTEIINKPEDVKEVNQNIISMIINTSDKNIVLYMMIFVSGIIGVSIVILVIFKSNKKNRKRKIK